MMAARDGAHFGEGQWALENKTPRLAKRSILGVCTLPSYPPKHPTQSFMSSTAKNKTFGLADSTRTQPSETNARRDKNRRNPWLITYLYIPD
jgi:hypothetical protein